MINLQKKQPFNLSKADPGLTRVKIGLSWDVADHQAADVDASVFMLNESGKIPAESFFVFFNNLTSGDGAVVHTGDNRTGEGDGDDEEIHLTLNKVSSEVIQILIAITIHNSGEGVHFGNVKNPSARVYNMATNTVICQFELTESFPGCDSLILARFYRSGSDWEFEAMAQAFEGGLAAAVDLYS